MWTLSSVRHLLFFSIHIPTLGENRAVCLVCLPCSSHARVTVRPVAGAGAVVRPGHGEPFLFSCADVHRLEELCGRGGGTLFVSPVQVGGEEKPREGESETKKRREVGSQPTDRSAGLRIRLELFLFDEFILLYRAQPANS